MSIFRRRLMMGQGGRKPDHYDAETEFIQSTGTQYIDTNLKLSDSNYVIDAKFNISTDTSRYFAALFTNREKGYNTYGFAISNTRTYINPCNNPDVCIGITYSLNTDYTLSLKRGEATLNGTTYSNTDYNSGYSRNSLWIFRQWYNGVGISAKLYYLTIRHNDDIIMDFIPVRVGDVGYLFDKVSGKLFGNVGSGDFILGNDII